MLIKIHSSDHIHLIFVAFPGVNFYWLYISTPIILILALLLLGYLQKP